MIARDVFPGRGEAVGETRRFVRRALAGAGLPADATDDAVTCVCELATNAIEHTDSGQPGGTFEVLAEVSRGRVRIEVHDQGSAERPASRSEERSVAGAEDGRGLLMVKALGDAYAVEAPDGGRRVGVVLAVAAAEGVA